MVKLLKKFYSFNDSNIAKENIYKDFLNMLYNYWYEGITRKIAKNDYIS